jgi:dihydroorotate dehydrogenase
MGFGTLEDSVDGFVVNLSSPNTPGLVDLQTREFLTAIAEVSCEGKPLFVKLSPDLADGDLAGLCSLIAEDRRFTGVVLTNTSRHLAERLTGAPAGGLSGLPLAKRSLECVAIARKALPAPKLLIGVGGVCDAEGGRRMRAAGADLVEIYTGFVYRGPSLIRELKDI